MVAAVIGTEAPASAPKPTLIGVPAAPKTPEALFPRRAIMTEFIGVIPRLTRSGATTAAGVPNPAVPSRKFSKNHAKNITCTRRSFEMDSRW